MRRMEAWVLSLAPGAQPCVCTRTPLQHEGEILRGHAGAPIRCGEAGKRGGRAHQRSLGSCVDGRRIANLEVDRGLAMVGGCDCGNATVDLALKYHAHLWRRPACRTRN